MSSQGNTRTPPDNIASPNQLTSLCASSRKKARSKISPFGGNLRYFASPLSPRSPASRSVLAEALPSSVKGGQVSRKPESRQLDLKEFISRHFDRGAAIVHYEPWELNELTDQAKAVFRAGPSLVETHPPVVICGDIHGQYTDLLRIFYTCGPPNKVRYIFLGDYVDRGQHSLEVISLLLACKIRYPNRMILLRGNHEVRKINNLYGFKTELQQRYCDIAEWSSLYDAFNDVFAEMPLAALVDNKILCMHGGLSPDLNTLDDIRYIRRPMHVLPRGLAQDLLWSDPELNLSGFQPNKIRMVSVLFGEDAVHEKLKQLDLDLIVRAHQVVEYGYAFFAGRRMVTIFSASRYYDDVCNWGAVMMVDEELECTFKIFKPLEYHDRRVAGRPANDKTISAEDEEEIGGGTIKRQEVMPPPSQAQEAIAKIPSQKIN